MPRQRLVTAMRRLRGPVACVVMWLLAASWSGAQQSGALTGVQVLTALLTFFTGEGRSVLVTVTELGGRDAASTVRIAFYDPADRLISTHEDVLARGRPVHAEMSLDMAGPRTQVRASITILGQPERNSLPIVVLESIDPGSFTVEQRVYCAPQAHPEGPVTPNCSGSAVRPITAAE